MLLIAIGLFRKQEPSFFENAAELIILGGIKVRIRYDFKEPTVKMNNNIKNKLDFELRKQIFRFQGLTSKNRKITFDRIARRN